MLTNKQRGNSALSNTPTRECLCSVSTQSHCAAATVLHQLTTAHKSTHFIFIVHYCINKTPSIGCFSFAVAHQDESTGTVSTGSGGSESSRTHQDGQGDFQPDSEEGEEEEGVESGQDENHLSQVRSVRCND